MMQLLTTEILDWVNPKDVNLDNYSKASPIDYFLVIDLDYSDELHDLHNAYPLASEQIKVMKNIGPNINYKW